MPFVSAPSPSTPTRPRAVLTRAQARVLWSVLAAASVVGVVSSLAVAAIAPPSPGAEALGPIFLGVTAVMVTLDLAMAYVVTARMRRKPPPGTPADGLAGTQMIVACAVALGATLMCCIFYFVSREGLLLAFVLPSAAVMLHWFPSQARWARLAPGAPAADGTPAGRRPLVRE